MELIRRKAAGRLAEVFGPDWVDADREARIAGHSAYAPRAFAKLPGRWQEALLSLCLLTGLTVGCMIGAALGVDADIGGVGIAMILLILGCDALKHRGLMKAPTESGITFWGQMYVPIVVATAASQNVRGALSGGLMAILAVLSAVGLNRAASRKQIPMCSLRTLTRLQVQVLPRQWMVGPSSDSRLWLGETLTGASSAVNGRACPRHEPSAGTGQPL